MPDEPDDTQPTPDGSATPPALEAPPAQEPAAEETTIVAPAQTPNSEQDDTDRREARRQREKKRSRKTWRRRRKAIGRTIAVALGLITAAFVGAQIRETWRQSQLTYLQTRSQDFLRVEFGSPSMGCLYDWWTPRAGPDLNAAAEGTPADVQCQTLRTDYAEYSEVMLYVEEALMYFVEEARVTCSNGVNYGRELEIWRGDVSEDVTGAFSFYILNRFGDPELGYATPLGVTLDPAASVRRYLEQARLFDVTLSDLCVDGERFRSGLQFTVENEPWVAEICGNASSEVITRNYKTDNIFDAAYCRQIHYVEPTLGRRASRLIDAVDRWGIALPF